MLRRLLPGLVIAALALALLAYRLDWSGVQRAFAEVRGEWLLASMAVSFAAIWLKGQRWAMAAAGLDAPPPRRRLFTATLVGIAGNFLLPARLGDFARAAVLRRHNPVPATLLLVAGWGVMVFDFVAVAGILVAGALGGRTVAETPVLLAVFGGGAGVLVFLAWVAGRPQLARRLVARLPRAIHRRLAPFVDKALSGLRFLRSAKLVGAAALLTAAVWLLEAGALWLGLEAFAIDASLAQAAMLAAAIGLSFALPLTPGNLGTYQWIAVLVLGLWNVPADRAFAFGLGYQAANLLAVVGVAAILLQREGLSLRRIAERAAEEAAADVGRAKESSA